ncbi:hypothetical protein SPRG_05771 [Saprolegnia parasitica CBS 223.65]|uniref:RanBD1 domain-containing protein n=1 Tax=Saprolegnia parasitica (strain CBS 223.65) TaxID=695850 RepID=A0A067CI78_SAPPC|nr:hypothetical protein SPRG_05771 [Saprolegnia parasitica CBS 223.65]KDO28900.1 hypothetical protein SPRG_05771 [Saprolegnia parasitica CBS 223.65]|eukprot:XP_012200444.1 hypothetical protein SPRG_05771 [Saprolegnia parasitica CBS 223.65]
MAKRRNENGQMRREEYEAAEDRDPREDDTVVGFGMTRASDTEISKRRIVMPKGKRAAPAQAAPAAAPASSNPFSGFTGLTQAAPAPSANPFSGFTGLTNPTPAAKPVAAKAPAAPLSNDWVKTTTSGLSRDAALGAVMEVLNKEFFAFVSQQVVENPMTFWNGAVQDYIRHAHELEAKVAALHAPAKKIAAPSTSVSFGATEKTLSSGFSVGVTPTTSNDKPSTGLSFGAAPTSTTTTTGFLFGAAAPSATTSSPAKPATTTGFSFSAAAPSATTSSPAKPATTTGFSFSAAAPSATTSSPAKPATTTGFLFGAAATPASPAKPATSSGFTFGSTTTTSSPAPAATTSPAKPTSSFTFGATPAASASTSAFATAPASFSFSGAPAPAPSSFAFNLPKAAPAPAATEDEDDENIGREEATVIIKSSSEADETVLYEVDAIRIRHFKTDAKTGEKRWADIGRHPFKILQNKTTKASRILSRNSIGKIVINAALYKGLEVTVTSNKKSVMLTLLHDGEPTSMLLGIAADRVEELKAKIEGACPQ